MERRSRSRRGVIPRRYGPEIKALIEETVLRHTTPQFEFKVGDEVIDCHGEQRTITGFLTQDLVWLDHVDTCSISQCLKKVEDVVE